MNARLHHSDIYRFPLFRGGQPDPYFSRQVLMVTLYDSNAMRYPRPMIKTFADKTTVAIFAGQKVKRIEANLQQAAKRKLDVLNAVADVEELRVPPSNKLEKLGGNRNGQWSIRVNKQWRICFYWEDDNAWEVEFVDYH